jgi:hypothetical protein
MSSGVYAKSYDMQVHCRKCLYEGSCEVFVDREIQSYYWDCPMCGTEWDAEGVPYMEGY